MICSLMTSTPWNLPTGIHDRLLAPTTGRVIDVTTNIDFSKLPDDPAEREAMIKAAYLRAYIEDAKPRIQKAIETGVGVMVHCPPGDNIDVAKTLAKELRDLEVVVPNPNDGTWSGAFRTITRRIRAIAVGGTEQASAKGKRLQQTIFRNYSQAEIDALIFVKAVGRGDDFPRAKLLIDLDPASVAAWRGVLQIGGRATRLVKDERGRPIPALWINYLAPHMQDQYTCVMALGGESGQNYIRVAQQAHVTEVPRRERARRLLGDNVISAAIGETIKTITVSHEEDDTEPSEYVPMGFQELVRYLLVSEVTMNHIFKQEGLALDTTLDEEDLEILFSDFPDLRPTPLPESGYTSVTRLLALLDRSDITTSRRLRLLAKPHGIEFGRFVGKDSPPDFYVTDAQAAILVEALRR